MPTGPGIEVVTASGADALAAGERFWWTRWDGVRPLVVGPGQVLYKVGEVNDEGPEVVITLYRP